LPSEAFEPRFDHDDGDSGPGAGEDADSDEDDGIQRRSCTPFNEMSMSATSNTAKSVAELKRQQHYVERVVEESPIKQEILNVMPYNSCVPTLDFSRVILNMIRQYASQVSTPVTHNYLDILLRFA
jgi:hypothetical protein